MLKRQARTRIRTHPVKRDGKTFSRGQHKRQEPRAAKGPRKPLFSSKPRSSGATPATQAGQAVKQQAQAHPKATTAIAWGSSAVLVILAVTVMAGAGSPLVVAAVMLVAGRHWLKRKA